MPTNIYSVFIMRQLLCQDTFHLIVTTPSASLKVNLRLRLDLESWGWVRQKGWCWDSNTQCLTPKSRPFVTGPNARHKLGTGVLSEDGTVHKRKGMWWVRWKEGERLARRSQTCFWEISEWGTGSASNRVTRRSQSKRTLCPQYPGRVWHSFSRWAEEQRRRGNGRTGQKSWVTRQRAI